MADTNPSSQKDEVERIRVSLGRLTGILGGLAPVRAARPSLFGTPPNFVGMNYCWSFGSGGAELYRRVAQLINIFNGNMRWSFNPQFNQKGACIAVLASSNEFYSPVLDPKSLCAESGKDIVGGQQSLVDEIDKLCAFMESELGGIAQEPSFPDKHFATADLYEPGVYDVTLVRDVKTFRWPTPTSDDDETLDFGLTYDEWYALFFEVLGKSEGQTEVHPVDFQEEVSGYPILSRLNDIYDDAKVEASEMGQLRSECLRIETVSKYNAAAEKCVKKLLLICRRATDLKTGVYFSGQ